MDLVGRDGELRALRDALTATRAGRGGLVLLSGAAGMGKSALVSAFADEAAGAGATVLEGGGWESGGAPAYWPWIQALRSLVRTSGIPAVREWAGTGGPWVAHLLPELGAPGPLAPGASDGARFALVDAVSQLLLRAADGRPPLLVVLDDLHAAGGATARLLQFLAREARHTPLLLVAAYPPVEARWDPQIAEVVAALEAASPPLRLSALGHDDVVALVARTAGAAPPPEVVAAVVDRTGGNPLFVAEVGRLIAAGTAQSWPVPPGIRQAIRARAARLPDAAPVHAVASVLGREVEPALLAEILDVPAADLTAALAAAVDAQLLSAAAGRVRFAHDLVRETLYADLAPRERTRWHATAATLLARRVPHDAEHLEHLAHHALAATPLFDPVAAAAYAEAAANAAATLAAHRRAAELYEAALAALEHQVPLDLDRRCALLIELGRALVRTGDPGSARQVLDRAATLARRGGDATALGQAALVRTDRLDFNEVDREGLALLEDAAAGLAGTDTGLEARVLARWAVTGYHARPEQRGELADRAVAVARSAGDSQALGQALSARLYVRWGTEPAEVVRPVADEIVALAEATGDRERAVDGRLWRLIALLELGELTEAERELHAVDRDAEALRQPLYRLLAASRRSTLALLRGRPEEALAHAKAAREIGHRGNEPDTDAVYWGQAFVLWQEGALSAEDRDEVEAILRPLIAASPLFAGHAVGLVLLCLGTGRADEARGHYDAIVRRGVGELPHDMTRVWTLTQLALACVAFADRATAELLYRELLPLAGRCAVMAGAVVCSGAVDHYLGLLAGCAGRPDDAAGHLERAVALHARMGAPSLLARSRQALIEVTARPAAPPTDRPRLDRAGELWTVRFVGRESTVPDVVGLHYLATLVATPGREVGALDLVRMRGAAPRGKPDRDGLAADRGGPVDEVLDAPARAAYRARLAELAAELDEAEQWNDSARAARLRAERDFVAHELGAALGKGGRPRAMATDAERARISVTRALRAAIERIGRVDAAAGAHLARAVRTGAFCSYHPERTGPTRPR
jgi:tetratricopeptide (TPR) repeat protein